MTGIVGAIVAFAVAVTAGTGVEAENRTSDLSFGDRGEAVADLNSALVEAGFNPDRDNRFGSKTRHAVYAFQKHHGLRTIGRFSSFMWGLLEDPIELPWRPEADRVEIDIGRQVLYVVEERRVTLVLPISSGNGREYLTESGRTARATTPEGVYSFQRRIAGMREAFLGQMWNPYYFYRGYAIHGSPSVPNYPASHGCIRVTMWDMDLLLAHFEIGQAVYVYGRRTEPPPPGLRPRVPPFI